LAIKNIDSPLNLKMAAKVIPHFALCGGNDGCLGSREGEKKGRKEK